jgi:methionyl-tRNA synthetase
MSSRVLVTAALPYANGAIHLGHLLEAVQTDVYVRARKLAGEDVVFMWADDTHGTPIQVRAQREGITPEELIARAYDEHLAVYRDFNIGFDIFHTTHSDESRRHCTAIFKAMETKGDIASRDVEQLYCPHDQMFLPDRFVRGTCPKCGSADQYGDVCEKCSSTYATTDLGDPRCGVCGKTPELRSSKHLFVPLAPHEAFLRQWVSGEGEEPTVLQDSVRNYVMSWIDAGLRDWDISRDAPYFGFEIPGHPGKYFYVWFDAPIGYVAATDRYCQDTGKDFASYWLAAGQDTEIVHVIGKDIVYFHCLFWPAMLHSAGYTTPRRVQVHGWLTVNGEKMSKTRGTFVLARTYLNHLPPDYLRYYFASKLSAGQDDLDLSLEDFANKVNADLVNRCANLASRCMKLLAGKLDNRLGDLDEKGLALVEEGRRAVAQAAAYFREFENSKALKLALELASAADLYVTEAAPWKLVNTDAERARTVCSVGVAVSLFVAAILKPVLPQWAENVEKMCRLERPLDFVHPIPVLPRGHQLGPYIALAERINVANLEAMIEASKEESAKKPSFTYEVEPLAAETTIDQFGPIDMRVGRVLVCSRVEGSDKLLALKIDLGPLGVRSIFSGIASAYAPEDLLGKNVVVFANLKPRKMRFGISEGMVLSAAGLDGSITVLEAGERALPGQKIG